MPESSHQLPLTVVVNGQPTDVLADTRKALESIIPIALDQTGNAGQPPDNWELRDAAGTVLDLHRHIESYHFAPGTRLFLNLKAGVGGEVDQFVDPAVSIAKFDQEVAEYRALTHEYATRGWFLVDADFPEIFVVMAAPNLRPAPIVCGVLLDYTNYDADPPSVRLSDPFSRIPYRAKELPTTLNRAVPAQAMPLPGVPGGNLQMHAVQPLMQAHEPDEVPFLCIAGVREYHEHPGHSGDVWDLHRASGAGRLVRILEVIHRYGVAPVRDFQVQLVPQVGLQYGEAPQ